MYAVLPPPRVPSPSDLLTERLRLRPYRPADAAAFFAVLDTGRIRLLDSFPARVAAVQTLADASRTLAQFARDWRTGRLYVLGIWHAATGHYLGDISLRPGWATPISAEIGYYLAADAEGHGYAREALAAAVQFGFAAPLSAAYLTLRCRRNNPRSIAVAEAVGFRPVAARRRLWPNRQADIVHFRLERP